MPEARNVQIQLAQNGDAAGIQALMVWFIRHTTSSWRYRAMDLAETASWLQKHQDTPAHRVWVAVAQDRIVGYSCLSDFRAPEGYWPSAENSIYVLPEYAGQGIGKQLMQRILEQAARSDLQTIVAAIDSGNAASIRFHEQFGFVISGQLPRVGWKQDRWLDLVLMTCDVNQLRRKAPEEAKSR
ncbi:MAG: N-acetyltransferase [Clostridiaceae bacterium]|jgi:phosphinothricin acetyltransferase|nr:N-acetyltransferase [Clostridiaceae bacterium]